MKGMVFVVIDLKGGGVLERKLTFIHPDTRESTTIVFRLL